MTTVANNNWIPVETGTLPEQRLVETNLLMSDEVWVTFLNMDGEYETGTDKRINNTWAYYGDRVVAWCKMPKTYNPNEAEKPVTKAKWQQNYMSTLDFLLNCTDVDDTSVKVEGDKKIVRATFYGSEDLSWTEYEYVFDLDGNYISHRELAHHW